MSLCDTVREMRAVEYESDPVRDVIRNIDMAAFVVPVRLEYLAYEIRIEIQVRDRATGEKIPLQQRVNFQPFYFQGMEPNKVEYHVLERIRYALKQLLTHEVDECLLYRGQRVFDPHR